MMSFPAHAAWLAVLALLGIGLYGLLTSRNLIRVLIALQIIAKGTILALVAAGQLSGRVQLGQSLAVTVILVDTVIAVLALALVVQIRQRAGSVDAADLARLKG